MLIKYHKDNLLRFEQGILQSNEIMKIINSALLQQAAFYKRSTLNRSQFQIESSTRELFAAWSMAQNIIFLSWQILKQTRTMEKFRTLVLGSSWVFRQLLGSSVLGSSWVVWSWVVRQVEKRPLFKKWLLMLGKLKGAYWVSAVKLSKARDVEIDFCFEPKIEFYNPQDEHDLKKTFVDLENLYREKLEKKKLLSKTVEMEKENT